MKKIDILTEKVLKDPNASDFLKSIFETTTDDNFLLEIFGGCENLEEMEKTALLVYAENYKDAAADMVNNGLYKQAVNLMDDDIREFIHNILSPCTDTIFLAAYMAAHEQKYKQDFTI